MRKLVIAGLTAVALAIPSAASAQFFLGVRAGYALASGDAYKGYALKNNENGMVPVQVDFGLDVAKALAVGVYGSVGYTMISTDAKNTWCTGGNDCSAWNFRVGAQLTLHAPVGESKVWGGPLLGWEEQRYKITGTGGSLEVKYRGLEGGLQGGVDLPTSGAFRWGPFASATVAEFQSAGLTGSAAGLEPLNDKSPHYRFTFGLRGVFGL